MPHIEATEVPFEVNDAYGGMKPCNDVYEEMVEGGSGWESAWLLPQ